MTLNIAVAVSVDPMAMRLRTLLKKTTNQTEFTGVCVIPLIFARNLTKVSQIHQQLREENNSLTSKMAELHLEQMHKSYEYQPALQSIR